MRDDLPAWPAPAQPESATPLGVRLFGRFAIVVSLIGLSIVLALATWIVLNVEGPCHGPYDPNDVGMCGTGGWG